MEGNASSLRSLLLISVIALMVPMVIHRFRKLRIPVMVGEIICGIIVGRGCLKLVDPQEPFLNLLSLLGFTYLMFLGGMEIDFSTIAGGGRRISSRQRGFAGSPLALALVGFAITIGLSYAASHFLLMGGYLAPTTNPVMLALLLGTTSVGVVLPVLKETRSLETQFGQSIMTGAMVSDFATIFMATGVILLMAPGRKGFELVAMICLALAFYIVYRAGASFMANPLLKKIFIDLSHTSAQLRVRLAFAMMLLFAMLSESMGIEIVLGAFMAGGIFRLLFKGDSLITERNFDAIGYGFLIPVFFIMVGVRLEVEKLWENPALLGLMGLMLVVAFLVKIIPSLLMAPRYGTKDAVAAGFLMSGRLSLIIAFAEVAVAAKLLQPELETISIFIAIVTCITAPMVFSRMQAGKEETPGIGVFILGAGKVGRLLAQRLRSRHHMVSLIDTHPASVRKTRDLGLEVHLYKELTKEVLRENGIEKADLFVAATGRDKINFEACMKVKELFGTKNLVARVGNPKNASIFTEHGIRPVITPMASVVALENIMYRPAVYSLLSHEQEGMEVVEIAVTNPLIRGMMLKDIVLPGSALVMMVKQDGVTKIPHGNTVLELGDSVTLFLDEDSILEAARIFDPDRPDLHVDEPETTV